MIFLIIYYKYMNSYTILCWKTYLFSLGTLFADCKELSVVYIMFNKLLKLPNNDYGIKPELANYAS